MFAKKSFKNAYQMSYNMEEKNKVSTNDISHCTSSFFLYKGTYND